MAEKVFVPFPVDGPLDTANPPTGLEPGDLVEAVDTHHQYLGPRGGLTQQTWPYQSSASFPNRKAPIFNGTTGYGLAVIRPREACNLGTNWCLDLVIRPETVTHTSDSLLTVFSWAFAGDFTAIEVQLKAGGAAAGDQRKVNVVIKTSNTPGTVQATHTIVSTSQLSVGTTIDKTHHIRVLRSGGTATLYVNGTSEATDTTLGSYRHEASVAYNVAHSYDLSGDCGLAYGAYGPTSDSKRYQGRIYSVLLRAGTPGDVTRGLQDYAFPAQETTKFALYGSPNNGGTTAYEASLYKNIVTWTSMTHEAVDAPQPWSQPTVQGGVSHVDRQGRAWNVVLAGGTLFWRRVY